jgi:urease accessory protein
VTELTIIRGHVHADETQPNVSCILLTASRATLIKRRWRGAAENGKEFGFDLDHPLAHGDCFYMEGAEHYVVEQIPENVLEVSITDAEAAARTAWTLGNLHLVVQVLPDAIRVADDPAARKALADGHMAFQAASRIFLPISGSGHHHHGHAHD